MDKIRIIKEDIMGYWIEYTGEDQYIKKALNCLSLSSRQYLIDKSDYPIIELVAQLLKKSSFVLAIDGMCGSGKSTLAKRLQKIFQAHVYCMDDFYLPFEKRTQERMAMPAGHIDYERFEETVLKPISCHQDVYYQAYSCQLQTFQNIQVKSSSPYHIIEGSYSLYPNLVSYYTDCIVLKISSDMQKERLYKRNSKMYSQFIERWIPLENQYFNYYHIYEKYPVINM